jgi:hypothetical protein
MYEELKQVLDSKDKNFTIEEKTGRIIDVLRRISFFEKMVNVYGV